MHPDALHRELRNRLEILEAADRQRRERDRRRSRLLASAGKLCPALAVLGLAGWAVGQGVEIKTDNGAASDIQRFKVETGAASVNAYFMNSSVGIGTTSPATELHVFGTVDPVSAWCDAVGLAAGSFHGRRARGTPAAPTAVQTGDNLAIFGAYGYGATAYSAAPAANMNIKAAENWTDAAHGGYINFTTTAAGGVSTSVKMTLDSTGSLGIGTAAPLSKLEVVGSILASGTETMTMLYHGTNESGNPGATTGDGIRLRFQGDFFGGTSDAFVLEKTDYNNANPDGGIAFVNTGSDGVVEPSMVIKGQGDVGIGTATPDVRLYVGNASSTSNETLKVASQEDAAIHLVADTDNDNGNGEDDNPYLLFVQDNGITKAIIGETGTADLDPQGGAYTGTVNNDLLIGTLGLNSVKVGTNGAVRMTVADDGGVGIGTSSPGTYRLVVKELASSTDNGIRIINLAGDKTAQFWVGTGGAVIDAEGTTNLHLRTAGADRLFIQNATGEVGIGTTAPDRRLHVKESRGGAAGTNAIAHVENTAGSYADCLWLDQTGENGGTGSDFIEFHTNAGKIGDIDSDGGSVVNYNAFQGTHPSQSRQDPSRWRKGMIVRATGELMKNSDSQPMTELTDRDDDPGVYGVFWDMDPDQNWVFGDDVLPMFKLLGLGHGQVLVTDVGGDVRVGDYVTTTSRHPGYGRRQADRVLRSHTVGKALEAVDWDDVPVDPKLGFKWKMIAIVLVCG